MVFADLLLSNEHLLLVCFIYVLGAFLLFLMIIHCDFLCLYKLICLLMRINSLVSLLIIIDLTTFVCYEDILFPICYWQRDFYS
mgnify:CR=1 FL=1